MTFEVDPDDLYINATQSPDGLKMPMVYWAYKRQEGAITITEARSRARAILTACAIAESEAAILQGLQKINAPKGFAKKPEDPRLAGILQLIRTFRSPLPAGIEAIYRYNTQQPLIVFLPEWYGTQIQFPPHDAAGHAMHLLGAAEAAQTDGFLYHFMQDTIGANVDHVQPLIREFGLFRQRNELEDLFKTGD
jgi:hypothetical protein